MWRKRLLERRPRRVVVGVDRGEPVELVIDRRRLDARFGHQHARRPMRRDRHRFDRRRRADVLQRRKQEGPRALGVEPEVGPARVGGKRRVGLRSFGDDPAATVEHDQLDVGLADVEHGHAAVHAAPLPESAGTLDPLRPPREASRRRASRPPARADLSRCSLRAEAAPATSLRRAFNRAARASALRSPTKA